MGSPITFHFSHEFRLARAGRAAGGKAKRRLKAEGFHRRPGYGGQEWLKVSGARTEHEERREEVGVSVFPCFGAYKYSGPTGIRLFHKAATVEFKSLPLKQIGQISAQQC